MTPGGAPGTLTSAPAAVAAASLPFDVERVRADFPILFRTVHDGLPLVYLDSAATSQKPRSVLAAMREMEEHSNANVHRGVHVLAEEATERYESARATVARFLGAAGPDEVVFTKNATEAYNVVAYSLGNAGTPMAGPEAERFRVGPGDEIVVTEMEHHSNLVPWQMLCQRTGATLRWFRLTDEGRLDLDDLEDLVNERTKLVTFVHQSNILGTINPVEAIVRRARQVGALVLLDACQSVPHMGVDVGALDVDFLAFTGHKALGPTGIGVLWARRELLAAMTPFLGGGDMIDSVTMSGSTYAEPPHRFEAGTPPFTQAVGLAAGLDYLSAIGMDVVAAHEHTLTARALAGLNAMPGVRVIGPPGTRDRGGAISFAVEGVHPHDVGQSLDELGIAVRVGHHCARPTCLRYGVPATTRASFHVYTSPGEVDVLLEGLERVQAFWGVR